MKAFLALIQDQRRVTFLCGLFLLLSSLSAQNHYFGESKAEYRQAYFQAETQHKSDQLKTEKKEIFFSPTIAISLSPLLVQLQVLVHIPTLIMSHKRAHFKSCLSPPNLALS